MTDDPQLNISETKEGVTFSVYVSPRASKTKIAGLYDQTIKIRLAAPPVDGAANKELISYLAKRLSVPKSSVKIVAGETAKRKTIYITGATTADIISLV